jgi:hypothetical protein
MFYLTVIGGAFIAWLILVTLFTPHIPYHLEGDLDATSITSSACSSRPASSP